MIVLRNLTRRSVSGTLPNGTKFDLAPLGALGDKCAISPTEAAQLRSVDLGAYGLGLAYVEEPLVRSESTAAEPGHVRLVAPAQPGESNTNIGNLGGSQHDTMAESEE